MTHPDDPQQRYDMWMYWSSAENTNHPDDRPQKCTYQINPPNPEHTPMTRIAILDDTDPAKDSQLEEEPKLTERHFYFGSGETISRMVKDGDLIPNRYGEPFVKRRKKWGEGPYFLKIGNDRIPLHLQSVPIDNGFYVQVPKADIQRVYKHLVKLWKHLESLKPPQEKREIERPVLPKSMFDKIETTIIDFWKAIDAMKTTKGFGNVGMILAGPPGVGKSETMRWLSEVGRQEHNRNSYQLSMQELMNLLKDAMSINADNYPIVFIDDIDANLLRDRRETHNPMTSQFLTCLDGLDKQEGRVMVVSTNEDLDDVDPALLRPGRFDHILNFEYPKMDLITEFCTKRKIDINHAWFENWSFARIDMFCAKFKVAEFRYQTKLDVFYEKFIAEMGRHDDIVEGYQAEQADLRTAD